MKKVLFLHSSSELYGSDRSLLNLVKNLDKNKFSILVVLPEQGKLVDELRKLDNVNIIIRKIAVLRRKNLSLKGIITYIKNLISSILFLRKIIKVNDVDIVYTNTSVVFPGGIIAKLLRKKSVWHVREIIENKLERKIVSLIVNMFSDVIIANSKSTADAISKNKNKIRVIYNAVDSYDTSNNKSNSSNTINIGMAGRINRWKGQKLFVDLAEVICKTKENIKFQIAGDIYRGEDHILNELKRYISEKNLNDKVELLGQIENMGKFYNDIDIFVLPSIQPEPFGLVIIEAMANGLPVVATNHGGPIEIIDDNLNGYLVDYNDVTEMSIVVNKLIESKELRDKIGLEAIKKKEKMFNVDIYVKNISDVLMEG